MKRVDSCVTVRFVRITYTRGRPPPPPPSPPGTGDPGAAAAAEGTMAAVDEAYTTPTGFSYKTFLPAAVKVGMCSGAPEYEAFAPMWERAKAWLMCCGKRRLIGLRCRKVKLLRLRLRLTGLPKPGFQNGRRRHDRLQPRKILYNNNQIIKLLV